MKELGKRLRELRIKNDMSQDYVAGMLGVSAQAISKWENGKSDPDISNLISISSLFHVHVDDLLDKEQFRKNWEEDWRSLHESGDREKKLQFLKDAVSAFPGDYLFRYRLASEEFFCAELETDPGKRTRFLILADDHLESLQKEFPEFLTAIDMHVKVLFALDRKERAIELAKTSPNCERLLLSVLEGDELEKQKKRLVTMSLLNLFADLMRDGSYEAIKKAEALLLSVAANEAQFHGLLLDVYCREAQLYCDNEDYTAAIDALKKGLHLVKSTQPNKIIGVEESEAFFYPIIPLVPQNALMEKINSYLNDERFSCLHEVDGYAELLITQQISESSPNMSKNKSNEWRCVE